MDTDELLKLGISAAENAGELLLGGLQQARATTSSKTNITDLVSEIDYAAEASIVSTITSMRPDDGFLGEEGTNSTGSSGIRWIIDPLDGTINYIRDINHYSVSIAAADGDGSIVGVVHDPSRQETFTAIRGQGAYKNGVAIMPSETKTLEEAIIGTGFAYDPTIRRLQAEMLAKVAGNVANIRRMGSAALDLAWVACGRLDAYFDGTLNLWDIAAGSLIVSEAGGQVSPYKQHGAIPDFLAASNKHLALAWKQIIFDSLGMNDPH